MKVSCLAITEDRREFMPWLVWNFAKQTHPDKELIVVDSSEESVRDLLPDHTIYIRAEPGTNVPTKRNMAVEASTGELLTWMDDDDWQHPEKCSMLVESLDDKMVVGCRDAHFVELESLRCQPFSSPVVLFTSLGIRRELAVHLRFPAEIRKASDTMWLQQMVSRVPGQIKLLPKKDMVFWFCHHKNISNPAKKRFFFLPLTTLAEMYDEENWLETWEQIVALRERLDFSDVGTWEDFTKQQSASAQGSSRNGQPYQRAQDSLDAGKVMPMPGHDFVRLELTEGSEVQHGNGGYHSVMSGLAKRHVGILLSTDMAHTKDHSFRSLSWALQQGAGNGNGVSSVQPVVSHFVLQSLESCSEQTWSEQGPEELSGCVESGTLLSSWLRTLDTLVLFDQFLPHMIQIARELGVECIFVPSLAHTITRGEEIPTLWARDIQASGCSVWARTVKAAEVLRSVGLDPVLLPWSIPEPVANTRKIRPYEETKQIRFLVDAGQGGPSQRHGVDLAIRAFARAYRRDPELTLRIKTDRPLSEWMPGWEAITEGVPVEVVWGKESEHAQQRHIQWADVFVYPARWADVGLPLLKALHAGLPCIAANGWPMNELVEHEYNGLLVSASSYAGSGLSLRWESDIQNLSYAMLRIANGSELRQKLTCPAPGEQLARQRNFIAQIQQHLLKRGHSHPTSAAERGPSVFPFAYV